jgi:hypothetical protein
MGGFWSGRWGYGGKSDARTLVEDCRSLDINRLAREGVVRANARSSGNWRWSHQGVEVASVGYEADTTESVSGTLRLRYTVKRRAEVQDLHYPISLVTTPLPSGGRRWWFLCPASRNGGPACGRRVGKLYLPPGGTVFACRHCHRLAYTSSRESGKWDGLFRTLADTTGLPLESVRGTLMGDRREAELIRLQKAGHEIVKRAQRIPGSGKGKGA